MPNSNPTRAGYTFANWWTAASGGTQVTSSTALPTGNATYYAHWSGNTISCTWNSNGGSSVANTSATYSDTAKVPMPSANPTKAGYTFAGWWTAASGGTQVTSATTLPTSNPTYYAHWNANTITVTWNSNGGSTASNTSATYSDTAKVPMPSANPTRAGYTFAGWWTLASGGTAVTASTTLPSSNPTYYAHWSANTITLTWNSEGGSAVGNTSGTYSDTAKVPMPSANPTKAGYTFAGWWTAASGGTQVTASTTLPTSNPTYYAHWSANTITCTWNGNGGSTASNTSATYSDTAKVPMPGSNPTRAGYTFAGWWTLASGGTVVTSSTTLPSSNPTYYAHWIANTITIKWNSEGGSAVGNTSATYSESAKVPMPSANPTKPGRTFAGWYTQASGGTLVTADTSLPSSNAEYHARWTTDAYAITWKMGGHGSVPQGAKTTYGYDDADYTLPSPSHVPGWTFGGWYANEGLTGDAVTSIPHNSQGNKTFWAKWTQDEYTVTFDLAPLDGRPQAVHPVSLPVLGWHYGEDMASVAFPTPDRESGFYRNGYAFEGWAYKQDGSYVKVYDAASGRGVGAYNREGDATLYALWSPIEYTVIFDWNYEGGGTYTYEVAYDDMLSFSQGELDKERNRDYVLVGWRTVDGHELSFVDGTVRFSPAFSATAPRTITYLAQWKAPDPATIVLHADAHSSFAGGASVRTLSLDYGPASINLRDPKRGLDPLCDAGYDFIGWKRMATGSDGEPYRDEQGEWVLADDGSVTVVGPYLTGSLHLLAITSANACSVTLSPGTDGNGTAVPRTDVSYAGWSHPGDVYEFDISDFTGDDGAVSPLVLPEASRTGYAFMGWRLRGSEDEPKTDLAIDPKEISTSTTRNRVYEAVWSPKTYAILFVPNRDGMAPERTEAETVRMEASMGEAIAMPHPATRGSGAIFLSWALSARPALTDALFDAGDEVDVATLAPYADGTDTILVYAQWSPTISVTAPLWATIALDPESGDVIASENMALRASYGSSTSTPALEVASVRYDRLLRGQADIFDAPLVGTGVFDGGKVYLTVYAGCDKPDLSKDAISAVAPSLRIDLSSSVVIPKDSTEEGALTLRGAAGFDKRFTHDGDSLSLYYGLDFGEGVDPHAFIDSLPANDAKGANAWSSESYPIARVYYTVALAQDEGR